MIERQNDTNPLAEKIAEVFVDTFVESNTEANVYIILNDGSCLKSIVHQSGKRTTIQNITLRDYLRETRAAQDDSEKRTYRL